MITAGSVFPTVIYPCILVEQGKIPGLLYPDDNTRDPPRGPRGNEGLRSRVARLVSPKSLARSIRSVHCRAFAARSKFLYKLLSVHCRCFPTQIPNVRKDNLNYVLFPNFGKFGAVLEVVWSTYLSWWTLQMEKRQQ